MAEKTTIENLEDGAGLLVQGVVKFIRKPAKMGEDFILWLPRVYIRNGIIDVNAEYEIFMRKTAKKPT